MKRIAILLFFLVVSLNSIYSQEFLGIRQSNYAGVTGLDFNPASIADNRSKVDVTLIGLSLIGYNNLIFFNTKNMPYGWNKSLNSTDPKAVNWRDDMKIIIRDSIDFYKNQNRGAFFESDNTEKRSIFISTELDLFNAMVSIDRKRAVGFQIKNRTILSAKNISPELTTLVLKGFNYQNLFNLNLSEEVLNLSLNSWMEYNLSYAQILFDKDQHFFKGGGKLKLLKGVGSFYTYVDDIGYNLSNKDTALFINGNFNYGYSDNLGGYVEPNQSGTGLPIDEDFNFSSLFKKESKYGIGLDLGVVYEWRPDHEKYRYNTANEEGLWRKDLNKYKLRVGVAVNDIGGMKYRKGELSRDFRLNVNVFDLHEFDNIAGFRSFDSTITRLENEEKIVYNEDDGTFTMNLPTHTNIDIDYNVWKNIYVNAYSRINLRYNRKKQTIQYPNSIVFTPRWDHKNWGVSIPISYAQILGFRTGLGLRAGPLVFGVGDLRPLIAPKKNVNLRGLDFFLILKVPILHRKPKNIVAGDFIDVNADTDGDGLPDITDKCPQAKGAAGGDGCPPKIIHLIDEDGDIIGSDTILEDGTFVFKNLPTDQNHIFKIQAEDGDDDLGDILHLILRTPEGDTKIVAIRNEKGYYIYNYLPEEEAVIDSLAEEDGSLVILPKRNWTKLVHLVDEAGNILATDTLFIGKENFIFNNLPTDKNHFFMIEGEDDNMVTIILHNPEGDTKFNLTKKDSKGRYYFLPGDGTLLKLIEEEDVLIDLSVEEQEILNTAFSNLEFETGKNIILPTSFTSLEELAALLIKKPEWKLKIVGHTDNVGTEKNNLKLSQKRAQAVHNFLQKIGVKGHNIGVLYYGETRPIADNSTKEGRQKNRRVEMTVIQMK